MSREHTSRRFRRIVTPTTQNVLDAREAEESGYVVSALGHPISTQGEVWNDLETLFADYVRCYFESPDFVRE